ncbi:hypothetical protein B296_00033697, partial [Ensete ventricosum]
VKTLPAQLSPCSDGWGPIERLGSTAARFPPSDRPTTHVLASSRPETDTTIRRRSTVRYPAPENVDGRVRPHRGVFVSVLFFT